jgi:hypothetical protein
MRWKEPIDGDVKIKKKFALFPITIKKETRWLEWVNIRYKYFEDGWDYGWMAMEFVDEE